MHLTDVALESGYDFERAEAAGRPARLRAVDQPDARGDSRQRTGMSACDIYGLSEVIGPGVSYECWNKDGLHVNEDHFLVEVVDPQTGRARARGQGGRAGLHLAHQGGGAGHPLPQRRPGQHQLPSVRVRPGLRPAQQGLRAHRRHVRHPGRQRLSVVHRSGAAWTSSRSNRTTRSCSTGRARSIRSRSRWR